MTGTAGPHKSRLQGRIWKVLNLLQSSALVSSQMRTRLLRWGGAEIDSSARVAESVFFGSHRIQIGRHAFINVGTFIDGSDQVNIEDYVRIGPHVKILTGTHMFRSSEIRRWPSDKVIAMPVRIGRGSWLGINSTVLPGVNVGQGCVIGACALVDKSTEANGLYLGVPARLTKRLEVSEELPKEPWTKASPGDTISSRS